MSSADFRWNIIEHLKLVACPEAQLAYERKLNEQGCGWAPWELIEAWFDLYHPGLPMFDDAFIAEEHAVLAKFNQVIDKVAKRVPDASVQAMLDSPTWQRVVEAATRTIHCIHNGAIA